MALASTDAIQMIKEYKQTHVFDVGNVWPEDMITIRSWQQVACDELIKRMRQQPFADPKNIVEEFIIQMDDFADRHENTYQMFTTYKEVGENIAALLDYPHE